ncbi:MAG TPA: glycosyltransferase [Chitinophaga sp.]
MKQADLDFTMIICAYNPEARILQRCLQAVRQLDVRGLTAEVILVDNNSTAPLRTLPYVKAAMEQAPGMQVLLVREQGLSHARIAAIACARGRHIVFFDDDNAPETGYLQGLQALIAAYPEVAAWGPGRVTVDFIDGISPAIMDFARGIFQQRQETEVRFARLPDWQSCYPYGTGLCIRADLLHQYAALAAAGRLTQSGRKGGQLSSGEDLQMVLLCIREGFAAGVAPALRLTHIIPGSRANRRYLERLIYGTYGSYEPSLLQVFPEKRPAVEKQLLPAPVFVRTAIRLWLRAKCSRRPQKTFDLIGYIAREGGRYKAVGKPLLALVRHMAASLQVR